MNETRLIWENALYQCPNCDEFGQGDYDQEECDYCDRVGLVSSTRRLLFFGKGTQCLCGPDCEGTCGYEAAQAVYDYYLSADEGRLIETYRNQKDEFWLFNMLKQLMSLVKPKEQ